MALCYRLKNYKTNLTDFLKSVRFKFFKMKIPEKITLNQINHIKELSSFIRQKEVEARENYFKILDNQVKLLNKREVEVFEINIWEKLMVCFETEEDKTDEITKGFFCVNEQYISTVFRTREDEEEPSKIEILDLEHFYSKDEVFHKNYNPFLNKKHPFHVIHFSRGMYNIINNSKLSFENILKIDNAWIDFQVEYSSNFFDSLLDKLPYTKKKLYLDDLRSAPEDFILVRNFEEFTQYILHHRMPGFISFDHDLGEEKTGYDCAKWLVEICMNRKIPLPEFTVHSQNPVGKKNIESLLRNFKKEQLK